MRSAYAQQKDYFDFGVRERLRAFLDPIFTAGSLLLFKSSYPLLLLKRNCRIKQKRQLSKVVSLVVQ